MDPDAMRAAVGVSLASVRMRARHVPCANTAGWIALSYPNLNGAHVHGRQKANIK